MPTVPSPLLTAARSTFESLALLYAAPADVGVLSDDAVGARVAFVESSGLARRGSLQVIVTRDVADALAVHMLGAVGARDASSRLVYQRDAVGELANVICGNVLPALAGTATVFDLSAPCSVSSGEARRDPTSVEWLAVDGGWAQVALTWEDAA